MNWTEKQQEIIAHELKEIELIAEALQRDVGNEATLELQNRMKHLKEVIDEHE